MSSPLRISDNNSNFWQHVETTNLDEPILDQKSAVECIRLYCPDVGVFKLINLGIFIACSQPRVTNQKTVQTLIGFYLEVPNYPQPTVSSVVARTNLKIKSTSGKFTPQQYSYDIPLSVTEDGVIVDVNLDRLAHQIAASDVIGRLRYPT
jgi:hypothetical protein